MQFLFTLVICALLSAGSHAFSLLGPFEEWQTPALGYNPFGVDRGAPKNLGEEYRWNIPVITYGFDREFMDYFGLQGVAAVDEAFDILNRLPPASEMNLEAFPLDSRRANYRAIAADLMDLRSAALALVIEQMGLAAPERWIYALRSRHVRSFEDGTAWTNYVVVNRNFDPATWEPTPFVNDLRFSYRALEFKDPSFADALEYHIADPAYYGFTTVAGAAGSLVASTFSPGLWLFGLTRDDAAGLRYLLHPGNLNYEPLPSGVSAVGDFPLNFVDEALRPGRDKIRFESVPIDWEQIAGWSQTITFTDRYYAGIEFREQTLQRTITQPDILFTAANLDREETWPARFHASSPGYTRAVENKAGPGIMTPGVVITFGKLGLLNGNQNSGPHPEESSSFSYPRWGWFDGSTNPPVAFPINFAGFRTAKLEVAVEPADGANIIRWHIRGTPTMTYTLQRSVDLKTWEDMETIQSVTGRHTFASETGGSGIVFYRTVSTEP